MSRVFLGLCLGLLCGAKRTNQKISEQLGADGVERPFGDFGGGGGGFGFGDAMDFGGGFPNPFNKPKQPEQPQQPEQPEEEKATGGGWGFPDFNGGFPNPFNKPKQPEQQTGGGGGMFPGFDMNGMKDMMGGMMGDMMNCMQKENEICCSQSGDGPEFRKTVCLPLWYCMIAVGERDFGPVPPCDAPIQFGDAKKCKKDDEQMRSEMTMSKSMCFAKIKELYDLQAKLGTCVADIDNEKKKVEDERQDLVDLQNQAQECEKKKAEAKAQQSLGKSSDGSGGGQFCPAESSALTAAVAAYSEAIGQCISVQLSATVKIPEIDIQMPEIKVGTVSQGSFDLKMPDFSAPDFTGDVVVPGGGGKLNVAVGGQMGQMGQMEQSQQQSQAPKLTFDQRKANIQADIKECEDAKQKMPQKQQEIAGMKNNVMQQKQKACEEPNSLLQLGASPEAQISIQAFSMMKMVWTCQEVGVAIDALIAVLQRC